MPVVVLARTDDEIADVIDLVRSAKDSEVGLVIPPGNKAFQTPLNARLLAQFSRQNGRRTAIVSDDSRIQELARANGFSVYSSVPAFERGIEAAVPRTPSIASNRTAAGGAPAGATLGAGAWTAATTLQQPRHVLIEFSVNGFCVNNTVDRSHTAGECAISAGPQ